MTRLVAASLCVLSLAVVPRAQLDGLGKIHFPTSASAEAQVPFLRGVLLLHSFEYEDAREEFVAAQKAHPDFALAYWGEAMTWSHPVWRREYPEKARVALAKLAPTAAARRQKASNEREKMWLDCVEVLWGEGDREARHAAYADALAALRRAYPDDLEATAFHALAVLGTSIRGRDVRTYMRSASIGEEVYRQNPQHPGALHYLIHAYDDPVHAPLGLRMARVYDKVAPSAAHARHMPSHIYVALGMWKESAAANESAVAAADARRARKKLDLDARGWHSFWWLHYSYLQLGREKEATRLLAEMERDAKAQKSLRTRSHLVRMRAAHLVETGNWTGAGADIVIDLSGMRRKDVAMDQFVRGMVALRRGDLEAARAILVKLSADRMPELSVVGGGVASCCAPDDAPDEVFALAGRQTATVLGLQLEAALRLQEKRSDESVALLQRAAVAENGMDYDFGPPPVVKPAHEMLGEVYLSMGRAEVAVVEFEAALARAPRRVVSLLGLRRALFALGDRERTQAVEDELVEIWSGADEVPPVRTGPSSPRGK